MADYHRRHFINWQLCKKITFIKVVQKFNCVRQLSGRLNECLHFSEWAHTLLDVLLNADCHEHQSLTNLYESRVNH